MVECDGYLLINEVAEEMKKIQYSFIYKHQPRFVVFVVDSETMTNTVRITLDYTYSYSIFKTERLWRGFIDLYINKVAICNKTYPRDLIDALHRLYRLGWRYNGVVSGHTS